MKIAFSSLMRGLIGGLFFLLSSNIAIAQTEMSKTVSKDAMSSLEWAACPSPLDVDGCHISILHGDPAKPNTDLLFKLEPGISVPRHWHTSAERMILISGEMKVTYDGEETRTFKSGTYAFGPANKPHEAKCLETGEPCVLFIAFEEPVDAFVE